jgi:hypothetical protein
MPNAQVKIFGERNTGTNALRKLIDTNSASWCLAGTAGEIEPKAARAIERSFWLTDRERERRIDAIFARSSDLFAWKHCATNFDDPSVFDGALVLIAVRHPASWVLSLFRNPYHLLGRKPRNLAQFLDFEWQTAGRERLSTQRFRPLDLYAAKIDSYLALARSLEERGISHRFVRFEDIVLEQEQLFESLKPDLCGAAVEFQPVRKSTKTRRKNADSYREYYGSERWRDELAGLESTVDRRVDWVPLGRFGYAPI